MAPLRLSSSGVIAASLCRARALLRPSHLLCLLLPSVLLIVSLSGHARHNAPARARVLPTSISITPFRIIYDADKCIVGLIVYLYTVVDTSSYFGIHSSHLFWFTQFWISLPFVIYYYYTMLPLPFLRLLHFIPAQNHPPTSPSPSVWRCSCPPPLDPSGKAVIDLRPSAHVSAVPSCSSCLSVSQHTRITCTYSASRFWRAHPHPSLYFLQLYIGPSLITRMSPVLFWIHPCPHRYPHGLRSEAVTFDSDSAVASSCLTSILDIVPLRWFCSRFTVQH